MSIGVPGSGKSTFLEWLQLQLASVEEELVMSGKQAIPLLLRVRQLDPRNLPRGAELSEKATASKDRAALMPLGWIDRQMQAGCVLLMLDGLDETEPEIRDRYVLPWLHDLCRDYPHCRYLISSRPVGYPPGALKTLGFAECSVQDFDDTEIGEYCRHWCTAICLARNEPDEEARREGANDGTRIVQGFGDHPYIRNLARNPLMLSAICLVNYFEGGELPKDRAVLYRLCVEGLLHHWDHRRGIRSEFTLEEKLRACREVALAMQADDRAEYEADKVQQIFTNVLQNSQQAKLLLEHIRYRTGLLLERRPNIFAFAHLTFQEYLAARSIYEGNRLDFNANRLAHEHHDGRWKEVIALYCGLASTATAREMIEKLITQPDSLELASVLSEAYLSAGPELAQDVPFRRMVLERIALAPEDGPGSVLDRFLPQEVVPIVNQLVGKSKNNLNVSASYSWLLSHSTQSDENMLYERLEDWHLLSPNQACELVHLLHAYGSDTILLKLASDAAMYTAPGPQFSGALSYISQAQIALLGLAWRASSPLQRSQNLRISPGVDAAFLHILRTLATSEDLKTFQNLRGVDFLEIRSQKRLPFNKTTWPEFASLARRLAERLLEALQNDPDWEKPRDRDDLNWEKQERDRAIRALISWADSLERAITSQREKKVIMKTPRKRRALKGQDRGDRV